MTERQSAACGILAFVIFWVALWGFAAAQKKSRHIGRTAVSPDPSRPVPVGAKECRYDRIDAKRRLCASIQRSPPQT